MNADTRNERPARGEPFDFDRLLQNFLNSYFNLRIGIAVLVLALPLVLVIGGKLQGTEVLNSLSAYYYVTAGTVAMRDVFVGGRYLSHPVQGLQRHGGLRP